MSVRSGYGVNVLRCCEDRARCAELPGDWLGPVARVCNTRRNLSGESWRPKRSPMGVAAEALAVGRGGRASAAFDRDSVRIIVSRKLVRACSQRMTTAFRCYSAAAPPDKVLTGSLQSTCDASSIVLFTRNPLNNWCRRLSGDPPSAFGSFPRRGGKRGSELFRVFLALRLI